MNVKASAAAAKKADGVVVNGVLDNARDAMSYSTGSVLVRYAALAVWYPACAAVILRRYSLSTWRKWVLNTVSVC